MKLRNFFSVFCFIVLCGQTISATEVKITMNNESATMTLQHKISGEQVAVGEPQSKVYTFNAEPGDYVLTAYATNGTTCNGTIDISIQDATEPQEITVLTITAYATNSGWVVGEDYYLDATVNSLTGKQQNITIGESATAGRKTFLALRGNSYNVAYIPSQTHQAEGYTTGYKGGTVTANVTASFAIPLAGEISIATPLNATLTIGIKFTHFTDFMPIEPLSIDTGTDSKNYKFRLADKQVYNYRATQQGGLTQAGYFTMSTDENKRPAICFTEDDFNAHNPKSVNHDVQSNKGYETGDIFININPEGYLRLNLGDSYTAHAMRTWQLTDNAVNNYFIEPDFHYQVIDFEGQPSSDVIQVEQTAGSAWAQIKAIGKGTAVVLVTYDGINLNYYSGATKKEYLGGEYWGAIWQENTAVYVVSVSENESAAVPNMVINEAYNEDAKKNAGIYVDAEHDVFYYLDTEEGHQFTFSPLNVAKVELAYPTITEQGVTFAGFSTSGVNQNEDGTYTILLKHGRQIVRLTDTEGNATYQVLTAKQCHRQITNLTREDSETFQPGDQIMIQYSGLFHPANKLAGIYNMSAYVTYNNVPNGSSLIQGSSQYTFGSSAKAQAVTIQIPADYDTSTNPQFVMDEGVIQVNGFGDPIGNHRIINPAAGRSPNFTAIAHKTYFGALPPVVITFNNSGTTTDLETINGNNSNPSDNSNYSDNSDYPNSSNNSDYSNNITIYDLSGRIIHLNATATDLPHLTSGIYIIRQTNHSTKIMIP